MFLRLSVLFAIVLVLAACSARRAEPDVAAPPVTQWNNLPQSTVWNKAALAALSDHGAPLVQATPRDIDRWCPAYAKADTARRQAFWVGFLSALSRYESTFNPRAVGGGGRWFGLLQISPGTARGYGCRARSGDALKAGGENLSCAIRIMSKTVTRDNAVALSDGGWRGVAADWGPIRDSGKRAAMMAYTSALPACAN